MRRVIGVTLTSVALGVAVCLIPSGHSSSVSNLAGQQVPPNQDNKTFDQAKKLGELRQQITGKERTPAEQVYKNIQDYKGVPAAGLLRGMEFYTKSLGVDCTHCHVVDQWEKDDKPTKQIAREMGALVDNIGTSLKKIKNLKSERPGVSCVTCHRGQVKPAISLPAPAKTG